jgi:RNA polymerase sigma-70 factor (ECF subfamily)
MDEGAFSRAICGERLFLVRWIRTKFRLSTDDAEDFVQDTLVKAWDNRDRYDDQQKMRAWLMMILVHLVLSHKRRAWRVQLTDDMGLFETGIPGNQFDALYLKEVLAKMVTLPLDQLDALIFVARGEQYDEAADEMQCATGTTKSRVARGRRALKEALGETLD